MLLKSQENNSAENRYRVGQSKTIESASSYFLKRIKMKSVIWSYNKLYAQIDLLIYYPKKIIAPPLKKNNGKCTINIIMSPSWISGTKEFT